ncbi:LPP20 family lipoprotein [Hylemonella sp. W303a]|uniref:LPP20 family lipoprotein n=1 Tax=Hylemonella sp. W303a TaxID=3389873 RepID=UPI00396B100E
MLARLTVTALFFFTAAPLAGAATCPGNGAQPPWVASPDAISGAFFFAAGVSSLSSGPLAERLDSARQNALRSLASLIQVEVRNSLTMEQSQRQSGGAVLTESTLRTLTETSTQATLENVETVATWEDAANCQVWVRVRIAQQIVEEKKRAALARQWFTQFNEQLATAQDETQPLGARQTALEAAQDGLPRITLALIPEASSPAYYTQLLRRLDTSLGTAARELEGVRQRLAQADAQLLKAEDAPDEAAKARLRLSAIGTYRDLLRQHANGLPPLFAPGDLYLKLAEAEELRANRCGAKTYYQLALTARQLVDRSAVARQRASSLNCSAADLETARWRQYFEGRPLELLCLQRVQTALTAQTTHAVQSAQTASTTPWHKACDEVGNGFRALGADIQTRNATLPPAQTQALLQGNLPEKLGAPGQTDRPMLVVLASGKLNSRQDTSPNGSPSRAYQFEGLLWTLLWDGGKPVYTDRFQGLTGWNPVSAEMTMDVLALNVVRRWQERFGKFLNPEISP